MSNNFSFDFCQNVLTVVRCRNKSNNDYFQEARDQLLQNEDALIHFIRHAWNGGELGSLLQDLPKCDALFLGLSVSSQPDQIAFDCLRLIENNTIHPQEAIECLDTLKCFLRFSDEYVNFEKLFRYIHNVTKTVSDLLLRQSSPLHGLEDRMLHLVVIGIDSLATMRKGLPNTDTPITNPFPRADVEIIDLLLQSKWPEHLRFHLIQIIFSIEPLLKKRHSPLFQDHICEYCLSSEYQELSDYSVLLSVAITFLEKRREASWGHVIRLLYSHIPESAVSYAEMNLNSVLVASPSACAFLVCTIEDTGLFFLQYFARVSDLSSSDKHFTAHSFHYIEFTDTPLVPLITLADLQFLLLLYRIRRESLLAQQAVNRSDQVHASSTKAVLAGFAADPVDTDDIEQECSEERKLQQTRDSRALFLTILVITRVTYLSLYSNREPYAQSDLFNDRLLSVVSGAISQGNSDSDAWLGQARCDVIVALCFSLVQDPAVATECVELLQTKMEDGCDNTKIDSNSPPLTSDHNVWPPIDFSQLTPEFLIRNMISFVFCKYPQLHVMILESLLGHLRRYLEVEEDKQSAEVLEEITVTSPQSSSSPTSSYTILLEVFLNLFPLHVESVNSIDTHFAQIVPILVQAHIVSKSYKLSSAMDQLEHILTSLVAIGSHILDSTMLAVSRETIASTDTPLNMRTFMVTFLFHVLTKASTDMHAELVVAILPCLHFPVERQRLLMRDLQSTLLLRALDFADEALVILRDAINPLIAAFFDNCNGCVGVFAYQSYVRFSESTQVSKEQSTNLDENKVEGIEGFISFRRDLTVMLNLLWIIELLLSPNTCVESLELLCAELIELQDTSDHINNYNESGTVEDKRKLVMPKSRKDNSMVTDYLISLIRFFSDGFYRSNMTIGHLAVAKQILDAFFDILVISGSQLSLTYFKARGISLPVILRARMHAAVVQVGGFVDLLLDLACDSYFNLASLESDSRMPHWPSRVIDHPTFSSAVEAFYPQPSTLHCKTMMVAAQSCYQKYFSTYFSEMFLLLEEFISLSSTSSSKERNRVSSSISTEFNKASSSCPPSLLLGFIGYTCARCLDFPTIMTVYSKFGLVEQEEYMLTYICTSGQAVIAVPDFNSTDANELKSSLIGDIETSDDDFVEQDFLGQRKNKFHSMSNAESEDEESVIIESSSSRHNHNKSTSTGEHNSFQVSKLIDSFIRRLPKQQRLMIDKCDIATRRAGAKKNHVMVKSDDARHHLFDLRKEALLALSATVRAYIQTLDLSDPIQSLVGLTAIAEPLAYEMYLSVQQRLTLTLLKAFIQCLRTLRSEFSTYLPVGYTLESVRLYIQKSMELFAERNVSVGTDLVDLAYLYAGGDLSRAGLSFLELLVLSAIRVCQTNTDEEFLAQLKRSVLFLPITTDEAESASILAEFTSVLGDESPDFLKIATPIVDIYASSVIQIVSSLWASSFSTKKDVIASTQLDEIDDEEVMQSVLPEVAFGLCRITFLFLLPYHLREGVRGIECMTLLQQLPERYVSKVLVSVVKVFTRVIRECGLVVQTAINVKRVILSADGDSLLRFSTKRKDPNEGPIITKDSPRSSTLKKSILSHKPDSDWSFLLSILGIFNRHSFTQLIRVLEAIAKGDVQSPASGSKTRAQESLSFVSVHITKLARQILYKVEEFQWKLTQILQYTEGISDQKSKDSFSALMASIDSKGRVLLEVKVMSNGTSSRNNSGKIRSATIDEVWKNSELTSSTAKKTKRMRSRNRVIDDWLGDEAGDDAYADLEDFIV